MTALRTIPVRVVLVVGVTLQPVIAVAQTPPAFSVTVTERGELVEEVGTTRRIGRDDIETRNLRTLDEALRLFPGIYVRTGGDGTPRIDVRGFRSRHVLLLVNGVQVNSTSDGQFDPARVSTKAIREIKVSYGSSSILYGDNALAAVIEISTVDGRPDATVDVSAGTPDLRGIGGRYARTVGQWSLLVSASGYDTNGFRMPGSFTPTTVEDGHRRQNSDRDRGDVRGSLGYQLSPKASIASEWSFGTGSYGVPSSVINDTTDIFAQTPRFERVNQYRSATGQVSVVGEPWQRFNVRAWVYHNHQREDRARYDDATYTSMDDPLVSGTFDSRERTNVTGSSALARVDLQRLGSLRVAINQRRESFDSNGIIRDVTIPGTTGGGGGGRGGGSGTVSSPTTFDVRAFSTANHVDIYSSGIEWEARPAKRLGTVLGGAVNLQKRAGGDSDAVPTWLAGVTYDATAAMRLHASATRKIRMPSIDQLYNTSSGNTALRSEHAYGVDLGADYRLAPASTIGVSAFSTDARDFIERDSGAPFQNQDRYRFSGGEVTVRTTVIPRLDLRAGYSFLDSRDISADRLLQTRPRHRSTLEWRWTPIDGLAVRGSVYNASTQLFDSRGSGALQLRAPGFTVVDVGFTHTLARRYDVAFDVTNLFDRLYDQSYALPREGRAAVLTLRVRAGKMP